MRGREKRREMARIPREEGNALKVAHRERGEEGVRSGGRVLRRHLSVYKHRGGTRHDAK